MEAIGTLLGLIGILAMLVSFVSVLWPLKRLGLPTRKRSALALLISVWVIITGAALMPDTPGQPPAQSLDQAAPDHASQPETPVEPPQVEAAATPEEQAATPDQEPEPATQRTSAPGPTDSTATTTSAAATATTTASSRASRSRAIERHGVGHLRKAPCQESAFFSRPTSRFLSPT